MEDGISPGAAFEKVLVAALWPCVDYLLIYRHWETSVILFTKVRYKVFTDFHIYSSLLNPVVI